MGARLTNLCTYSRFFFNQVRLVVYQANTALVNDKKKKFFSSPDLQLHLPQPALTQQFWFGEVLGLGCRCRYGLVALRQNQQSCF